MARSDLLVNLVQSGVTGDFGQFRKTVEAVIAEERAKQHKVLAEKLEDILTTSHNSRPKNINTLFNKVNNLLYESIPQRKIEDLILSDDNKEICHEFIQEHHRSDLLRSYNLEPRNKLLLVGSPGNGKTSLAEAVAESLMIPFFVVRYEGVVGSYLGETAQHLKQVIEYVSTRKCVLLFDEFETLGKERGDTHETGEIKRLVSSLLMQIDSLPSHVVIIGATNHPELLDRAVWRRFQIRINIPKPSDKMIEDWFCKFEKNIKSKLGYAPAVLANYLSGSSFSEVEEFGITAYRKHILSLPNSDLKSIITLTLRQWQSRANKSIKGGDKN